MALLTDFTHRLRNTSRRQRAMLAAGGALIALLLYAALAFEFATEGGLRSAAREYFDAMNRGDWRTAYEREWFRMYPKLGITCDEYAAYMARERKPSQRLERWFKLRDVRVAGGRGTVRVTWIDRRWPHERGPSRVERAKVLEEAARRFGSDERLEEYIRELKAERPSEPVLETAWVYDAKANRWRHGPTNLTTQKAPWFDRILDWHQLPPLDDWPVTHSWTGNHKALKEDFSIERGMWFVESEAHSEGWFFFSIETDDGQFVAGGGSTEDAPARSSVAGTSGPHVLEIENDAAATYELRIHTAPHAKPPD